MTSNRRGKQPLIPPENSIMFFKIILDTNLQDGKLKIPNKFTRKYGANLPNPIFLKAPDGIEWKVYWTRHEDGGIWLQKGWKEFATYYFLSHGHLVLFKYEETCILKVHICDESALEIDYRLHNTQGPQTRQRTSSSGVVGERSNLPHHVQTRNDMSQGPQPHKKLRTHSIGVVGQSSKLPQPVQMTCDQSQEDKGGIIQSLNKTATSSSEAPSFTIVLKPTYVKGHSVVIPIKFVKEHLKEKQGKDFKLQVLDGRTWLVNYKRGRLCTGWKEFACANHLKVGDVCLFEFTKSRLSFKVTIIRENGDLGRISDLKCINVPIQAMHEATKFRSRHPFFKVILKGNRKGDYRPRIPVAFMRKYFNKKYTVILQYANKSWPVHLVGKVQTKLSKGWFPFVKESGVQTGDVCVFELINKVCPVFNVHILRGHS